jgi:hypothetical protein
MAVLSKSESYCLACQRTHLLTDFYESDNPFHANGVLPYCKEQCKKIVDYYVKDKSDLGKGLFFACAVIGIPFMKDAYDNFALTAESKKVTDYFALYHKEYLAIKKNYKKKRIIDFSATDCDVTSFVAAKKSEAVVRQQLEELKQMWGDRDIEDLQYLEYRYTTYTDGKELTEYQAKLYRSLCLAELSEFKGDKTKEAIDIQAKIAKTLGIDQFNPDKELTNIEKTLEYQIAVLENEEPAIYYKDLEKYADFMSIGNYWENHVMRPLRNILTNSKEYNIIPDDEIKNVED